MNFDNESIKHAGIIDNSDRKVGDYLHDKIAENSELSFVSAYFTIYGFQALSDKLQKIKKLRFLFGEPDFIDSIDPAKDSKKSFQIQDENLILQNVLQQKSEAKQCHDWINDKVEIRTVGKKGFLHGKMYHIHNQNYDDFALIGSSNFTKSGLGMSKNPNIELNMVVDSKIQHKGLLEWFNKMWYDNEITEDAKQNVLDYLKKLYADYSPETIYFKTLYHIFENDLEDYKKGQLLLSYFRFEESKIWQKLFEFQKHAVKAAINKLERYNGCIIADSVGLGKTYEALGIIKYYELRNEKVLVLCPKKLEDNWTKYPSYNANKFNELAEDNFQFTVLAHTDLSRETGNSGNIDLAAFNWGAFNLVVIDESHNFRNATKGKTQDNGSKKMSRYEKLLEEIIKKGINTKVLLLSATPVNNSLTDLKNQIQFFTKENDNAFVESLGIVNISNIIKKANKEFTIWLKNENRNKNQLYDLFPAELFKLLDALTISRSRKHILKYYQDELAKIGKFPDRINLESVYSDIDLSDEFLSYDKLSSEIDEYELSIFKPTKYVKDEFKSNYEQKSDSGVKQFKQEDREKFLIGMMKVNFLKRLESSVEAFEITTGRTLDKIKLLIEKIDKFEQLKLKNENVDFESLFFEDDDEENSEFKEQLEIGKKLKFNIAHLNLEEWKIALKKDKDQIVLLYDAANKITPERDAKLSKLKALIKNKIENINTKFVNKGNKKVIIFTAFADTAKYLYENIHKWAATELKVHSALVTGGSDENKTTLAVNNNKFKTFDYILTNFSPKSKNRDEIENMPSDEIDILIGTDCISEGQNLQDCDYIINYDIHWNPVRIIQRFGRIDRIGSKNDKIYLQNFWPTEDLNKYIKLKSRVEARMVLVDISATGEDDVLNSSNDNQEETYREKQLKMFKNEEVPDLDDSEGSLSLNDFNLEDFRAALLQYIGKNKQELANAPLGIYAIVPKPHGEYNEFVKTKFTHEHANKLPSGIILYFVAKKITANSAEVQKKFNPLGKHFLIYITDKGQIHVSFNKPRVILEAFSDLCENQDKAIEKLTSLFNNETSQGKDMSAYSELINKAIDSIMTQAKAKEISHFFSSRKPTLLSEQERPKHSDDFLLMTWLIIK